MAIYGLLRDSTYDPEDVKHMGIAFEMALRHLRIKHRNSDRARIVAKLIIEAAQPGEKDPKAICSAAMACLEGPDSKCCNNPPCLKNTV